MLNASPYQLCQKLCWRNGRRPNLPSSAHDHFDPLMDLLLSDVAPDNRASPSLIQITIKHSKCDQFRKGNKFAWEKLPMLYVWLGL